ncbi:MAG: NAD(P)-dependent oxidoreductase [Aurantimonas endophytica]|uniref:NAD(P)-dependent oxidoreductase n=1 Tax=Aurantimonas endophytica TaxID=1522175 RepID=UPI00300194A1
MLQVAVLGASGRAGSQIVRELVARGHQVVAIARKPAAIPAIAGVTALRGDAADAASLAGLIRGSDAVISAIHFDVDAATILDALKAADVPRLLVTGGAASLEVAPGVRVIDTPDFPEAWKGEASKGIAFLDALRTEARIDWTYLSPAAQFEEGPRTGRFRTGSDRLLTDEAGESRISFADYAIAMVDELEQHRHPRSRFTVAY